MTDLVNFVMLVAASIGSMALGILAAYWMLRAGFAMMRRQDRPVIKGRTLVPTAEREPETIG
jgi:hypothetical protein